MPVLSKRTADRLHGLLWQSEHPLAVRLLAPAMFAPQVPFEFKRFELTSALSPGSTATAVRLDLVDGALVADDDDEFTVSDWQSVYRGRARDTYATPNDKGSRGLAWKPHDHEDWEIVWLEPLARRCTAKAKGAIAAGTVATPTSGTVDYVSPIDGGLVVVEDAAEELTVAHMTAIAAEDDGDGIIEWDETNDRWLFYPLACPAE